jgi:glutaredoxin
MKQVTLYSKPGCHLCDPVREVILAAQRSAEFELVVRNILDDPEDFERYKHAIPVVTVDGREIARYRLTEKQLLDALGKERA